MPQPWYNQAKSANSQNASTSTQQMLLQSWVALSACGAVLGVYRTPCHAVFHCLPL